MGDTQSVRHHVNISVLQDVITMEKLLATRESSLSGESTLNLRKQLLSAYCRSHDLEKAEVIVTSLEKEGSALTGGTLAQLVDLYAHHENVEEALRYRETLAQLEPAFTLDDSKVVKLAALLMKNNRYSGKGSYESLVCYK